VSPLGIPCKEPPWGTFSMIDLKTRSLVWQRPAGTVQDVVLGGVKTRLPVPLGKPTLGGAVNTASGLVFYAATQDYLRQGRGWRLVWMVVTTRLRPWCLA
jgi:quinate dehydrogenase (quinone)